MFVKKVLLVELGTQVLRCLDCKGEKASGLLKCLGHILHQSFLLVIPLMVVDLVLNYPKLSLHYWKSDFFFLNAYCFTCLVQSKMLKHLHKDCKIMYLSSKFPTVLAELWLS